MLRTLIRSASKRGAGVLIGLTSEPIGDAGLPILYDWTALEGLAGADKDASSSWPASQGAQVVAVGFSNWRDRVPKTRIKLLEGLTESSRVQLVQLSSGLNVGGMLREMQAAYADVLVVIGGGPGVEHLASIFASEQKPVIPIDLPLGKSKAELRGAEKIARLAMEKHGLYFRSEQGRNTTAAFSLLSLRQDRIDPDSYATRFLDFVSILERPTAFYVRLQSTSTREFTSVEHFFRRVVDPIIDEAGFARFEVGKEGSSEAFLNQEIFEKLHFCSLVIADLTDLRPNCLLELGYALGRGKRVIMTAKKGTNLAFDIAAIPCFFWDDRVPVGRQMKSLSAFMGRNLHRGPLVSQSMIQS